MATESVERHTALLNDPAFLKLLAQRSRLRWSLTILLSAGYFAYGMATLYFPDAMAVRFPGTAIPWVIVLGYALIFLSIVLSIVYVRVVGRLSDAAELTIGNYD